MSGIYIPGMEMPDCGYVCLKVFADGEVLMTKEHRGTLVITGIKEKVGTAVPIVEMEDCTEYYPLTNADRIRAMTDEELADFINDTEYGFIDRPGMCDVCEEHRIKTCYQCWLDWLREETTQKDGGQEE